MAKNGVMAECHWQVFLPSVLLHFIEHQFRSITDLSISDSYKLDSTETMATVSINPAVFPGESCQVFFFTECIVWNYVNIELCTKIEATLKWKMNIFPHFP